QLGYSNAATLQEKFGIPAVVFGMVQTLVLYAIYRAIRRKEMAQQTHHDELAAQHAAE
ncbi:MAG: hypothetical protein HN719_10125, partial [Alphaproteobacteria bacterium]|nr:hypothetical protein [Alphaproteobacteria bacterium]